MTNQVSPDSANSSFSPVPHYHLVPFIPQFPHYLKVSQYSMPLTPLTNENAQDFLPREARIFVGNLPVWLEHDEMVQSLRDIFSRFGPCYIKFREHMSKPSAFVQFPEEYQAGEAIQHNRQIFLEGRPLRIEPANGRGLRDAHPPFSPVPISRYSTYSPPASPDWGYQPQPQSMPMSMPMPMPVPMPVPQQGQMPAPGYEYYPFAGPQMPVPGYEYNHYFAPPPVYYNSYGKDTDGRWGQDQGWF